MFDINDLDIFDIDLLAGKSIDGAPPIKNILHHFRIAHVGWEMDAEGAIVRLENDEIRFVWTNHGGLCFGTKEELTMKTREYIKLLADTQKAIELLEEPTEED